MGTTNAPHIMTLVNSIIGVSILAMPFCYKQCGILLATLILIFSNLMTRLSCHYLLKSAIMTRRRNFEFLAFHAFGSSGKTAIELCIILLMIGTCIAFFVVMGDLGPAIIGSLLNVEHFSALKPAVLIGLAVFVVLPLGMLKNVDSLSSICTISFLFYLFLVFKVFIESTDNLFNLSWINEICYWKPSGILQCLPIFSMALSCQTQLFGIFDSVSNATLDRMNMIVKYALNLCTVLYISVGFFGYIAYYNQSFTGNLLMSFSESLFSELIKLGFVLSVAVTFPLVIFPCRSSLYSLLFKKAQVPHYELVTGGGNHIPEAQFKCITLCIITVSLIIGLLARNIEIVLGLLGSTVGVIICLLFPPFLFIYICNKATTEKILAQTMCALGFFIMIMGTYANLYLSESVTKIELQTWKSVENDKLEISAQKLEGRNDIKLSEKDDFKELEKNLDIIKNPIFESDIKNIKVENINNILAEDEKKEDNKRIEPPVPVDPEAAKSPEKDVNKVSSQINESNFRKNENENLPISSSKIVRKISDKEKKKLINEQKEVFKKIRNINSKSVKNIDKMKDVELDDNNLEKTALKKVENKDDSNKLFKIDDTVKNDHKNELKEKNDFNNEILVNRASKLAQEKLLLPVLKNTNEKSNEKVKTNENIIQRDILENNQNIGEREKRDLFYVKTISNNMKSGSSIIHSSGDNDIEVKTLESDLDKDIILKKNNVNGFVKNVVKNLSSNQSCDKDKTLLIEEVKNNSLVETIENEVNNIIVNKKENSENELQIDPISVKKSTNEANIESKRESIILAPKRLSNPSLLLDENIPSDSNLKPVSSDMIKPILRELKTFEIKKETGNRKK